MVRVGELVNLFDWNALRQHDLELVFGLDGLGGGLALGSLELCEVSLGLSLGRRWWFLWATLNDILNRASLEVLTKLLNFPDQLVCACLGSQHVLFDVVPVE
jgi:hypothetical protein